MDVALTRRQVRRVDQLAVEQYGMSGLVLMENAGRNAAAAMDDVYGPKGKAMICCGPGHNGGDGCVIARHLHNRSWTVRILVTGDASRMTSDTRTNWAIAEAMGLEGTVAPDATAQRAIVQTVRRDEIIVDALLGTGFCGEVRSPTAELIDAINTAAKRAVVAIDVPSGLDCDTGAASHATVRADLTITFAAGKIGFAVAAPYVGRVVVADIGAPRELLDVVLMEGPGPRHDAPAP